MDVQGVYVDPTKIQVIHDWSAPKTLNDLYSFLSLTNFYRRFVLWFSHIAWALIQVTKGGAKAKSVLVSQHKAFKDLKFYLCSTPVLILPDLLLSLKYHLQHCMQMVRETQQLVHLQHQNAFKRQKTI
jgi:hypothetical protein